MFHFGVISLLPEILDVLKYGITGRAIKQGLAKVDCWNPRDWSSRPYRQVDDKPYGGGPGMVMMYEPLEAAILAAHTQMSVDCKTIYLSPQGKHIGQSDLNKIVQEQQSLLFIAGRYEGIDERILERYVDEEWSLGDFVLSGGELAATVFIDSIIRLIPGSLGHSASARQDSFMNGLLDYPHYTRPARVHNQEVPSVLLKGNHKEIESWRRKQSLGKTWIKRPDLLEMIHLTEVDQQLLAEYKYEHGISSNEEPI